MEPSFWLQRWVENLIGFHQDKVNPWLEKYFDTLHLVPGDTVFVPLCGKSLDMTWLHQRGINVLGVELSAVAAEAFFQEAGRTVRATPDGLFVSYRDGGMEILCGDFFDLAPEQLGHVRAVYDRAALIALPPAMRERYVAHLRALLPRGTRGLLVTMEYAEGEMQGPPFSVSTAEVERLFADGFGIEALEDADLLGASPRFRDRGLSSLREKIYLYTRS
jgi:thiopurine S-methyltransferase